MTVMTSPETHNCERCPLGEHIQRREFVRVAVARSFGVLGALSLLPGGLAAMPFSAVRGTGPRVARVYPLPTADGVSIDRDESVIVARTGDKVFAFSLACPHQSTALRWDDRNHRFQCPKHKSRYEADGVFIDGRATRGLDRFAVKRDGQSLVVDLDALFREDRNPAEWAAAFVNVAAEK
jgi:nitrite reductase/ring-hydroxylating ferredoxin subunit